MIGLEIRKVTVVGAGLMGHGIAEVFALNGFEVTLEDAFPEALNKARKSIETSVDRMIKSGKIKQENRDGILGRLAYSSELEKASSEADLVIEAVPEIMDLKKDVLSKVSSSCRADTIIGTNTSNFRISDLADSVKGPDRFIGIHFFNPPVVLKLVEVIKGDSTSNSVFEQIFGLMKELGKVPIRVFKDSPGFVVNRINAPESLFFCLVIDKQIAKPEEVDHFARSNGLPMGPYELMDYVGIDTVVHSLDYYKKSLSPDYGKCHAFHDLYNRSELGLKTGKGFYVWKDGKAQIPPAEPTTKLDLMDILAVEINEAAKIVEEGIALPDDIETGVKLGMNRPFGPVSVASGLTNSEIMAKINSVHERMGLDVFKPAKSIESGKLREIFAKKELASAEVPASAAESPVTEQPKQASAYETLQLSREGKVAILELRNQKLNLINAKVVEDLERAVEEISSDREIVVAVLRGSNGIFSAGAELSQFFSSVADFMNFSRRGQTVFKKIQDSPKIFISQMEGYALGGGFELSLSCDIRFATEDVQIGFPELQRGILPGWTGTQRLAKLIGMSRASFLILSSERINGKQAHDLGIVSRVFPKDTVGKETMDFARKLSEEVAPVAAYLAKVSINRGSETPMDSGLWTEAISMGLLYGTEDIKEGVGAFLQKRKPEFKGK